MKTRKILLILADLCLMAYIVVALSSFNKPEEAKHLCHGVDVVVADATTHGFIDKKEVEKRLKKHAILPIGKPIARVKCRQIEETLLKTPFIRTAQCYTTQDGIVHVSITQRMPVVRIKAANNDDFYIDDSDCIMPGSEGSADLIIATGNINRQYATQYISPLARTLMADDMARNLFQQINITANHGVELVPRIGGHVVYLGKLPESRIKQERHKMIEEYVKDKLARLKTFYKYGMTTAGWNKYSVVNLEFKNQIICKRIDEQGI